MQAGGSIPCRGLPLARSLPACNLSAYFPPFSRRRVPATIARNARQVDGRIEP